MGRPDPQISSRDAVASAGASTTSRHWFDDIELIDLNAGTRVLVRAGAVEIPAALLCAAVHRSRPGRDRPLLAVSFVDEDEARVDAPSSNRAARQPAATASGVGFAAGRDAGLGSVARGSSPTTTRCSCRRTFPSITSSWARKTAWPTPLRRRENAGQGLQPVLHPRRRRPGQDAPAAGHLPGGACAATARCACTTPRATTS